MGFPDYKPDSPSEYTGKQIILNSDRVLFNAKEDSVLLFAQKSIGFSTEGSFNFDTGTGEGSHMIINTPLIYLGMEGDGRVLAKEPAVLGNKLAGGNSGETGVLEDILSLIDNLIGFLLTQYTVTDSMGNQTAPGINNFEPLQTTDIASISNIRAKLDSIKSKRVKLT